VGEDRDRRDRKPGDATEVEAAEKEERGDAEDEGVGEESSSKTRLDAVGNPDKPGVGPPPYTPKPG